MNSSLPDLKDATDFRCIGCGETCELDDDTASCDACNVPGKDSAICIGCSYGCNGCHLDFCEKHIELVGDSYYCLTCALRQQAVA